MVFTCPIAPVHYLDRSEQDFQAARSGATVETVQASEVAAFERRRHTNVAGRGDPQDARTLPGAIGPGLARPGLAWPGLRRGLRRVLGAELAAQQSKDFIRKEVSASTKTTSVSILRPPQCAA